MLKLNAAAAIAATLCFTLTPAPATSSAITNPAAAAAVTPQVAAAAVSASVMAEADLRAALDGHDDMPRVAPGQEREDFESWMSASPANRSDAIQFVSYLKVHGVEDVVPVWQLTRTSSSWRSCGAERFEVAPREKWDNIVRTLKFVEKDVVPAVGKVQAVSGYRNERLNRCSAGAPASAHRNFFALDLVPVDRSVSRGDLIRNVCAAHNRDGRDLDTGLGFYNGVRFHIDSNGYRRWGANGSSATSPCGAIA